MWKPVYVLIESDAIRLIIRNRNHSWMSGAWHLFTMSANRLQDRFELTIGLVGFELTGIFK